MIGSSGSTDYWALEIHRAIREAAVLSTAAVSGGREVILSGAKDVIIHQDDYSSVNPCQDGESQRSSETFQR